jgi:MAP/microtubule affinity-regulating kinase
MKNIYRETEIMRMLNHPNIIQMFEIIETKKEYCIVLEYAAGGEVLDYIVANGRLREAEAKKFIKQIANALVNKIGSKRKRRLSLFCIHKEIHFLIATFSNIFMD